MFVYNMISWYIYIYTHTSSFILYELYKYIYIYVRLSIFLTVYRQRIKVCQTPSSPSVFPLVTSGCDRWSCTSHWARGSHLVGWKHISGNKMRRKYSKIVDIYIYILYCSIYNFNWKSIFYIFCLEHRWGKRLEDCWLLERRLVALTQLWWDSYPATQIHASS